MTFTLPEGRITPTGTPIPTTNPGGDDLISVLMTVYNRERFVGEAIESILDQTYRNLEFVIVDDGSTDHSGKIVKELADRDSRIKFISHPTNLGISTAVKSGLPHCTGKYIGRMDSDDISLPNRLEVQYQYLESHPSIDVLGTSLDFMDSGGRLTGQSVIYPTDPLVIRYLMFYRCILHNPTVLMKASYYHGFSGFEEAEQAVPSDDYAFWVKGNFEYLYANLQERLFYYRLHDQQISTTRFDDQRTNFIRFVQPAYERLLGRPVAEQVIRAFYFVQRITVSDPRVHMPAVRTVYQAQRAFEKLNQLNAFQKRETRTYTYEKIKSYITKYKAHRAAFFLGGLYLLLLQPDRLLMDGWQQIRKFGSRTVL